MNLPNLDFHWSHRNDSTLVITVEIPLQKKEKAPKITTLSEESVFVSEFLETGVHKESTRRIYTNGLQAFKVFYQPQGTISDFFTRLDADLMLPKPKQERGSTNQL